MNNKEMSFLGHIGELRGHLIRISLAVVVCAVLVGWNIKYVMDGIIFAPTRPDFFSFRVINYFSSRLGMGKAFDMPEAFPIQNRSMFGDFDTMMQVSIYGGILVAFPYVIWELWRFISPALHENERKNSIFYILSTWLFFVLGALVGYFLVMPFMLNFSYFFRISDIIRKDYDLLSYISMFLKIELGMSVVFLFPIIVHVLTSLEILTPAVMQEYRRHAIVVIMVLAAIITPADALSMIAASLPLVGLYEISIIMSKLVYRRIQREKYRYK